MNIRSLACLLTLAMASSISAAAHAGIFRAYLSVNGNDGNPCTLQQPCRLLPAALNAVNVGGEIWMLDSANFNTSTVNITKSVTILAVPGALGSVVANNGDAIMIATANVSVTLRNLVILNLSGGNVGSGGLNGVTFFDGAALTIEDCEIYGMSGRGLRLFANNFARIAITNSVIRDNAFRNIGLSGPVRATIDRVRVLNSPIGVLVSSGVDLVISNSVITGGNDGGNGLGVKVQTNGTGDVNVAIESSVIKSSDTGLGVTSDSPNQAALVTVTRTAISANNTGVQTGVTAGGAVIVLNGSTISHNGVAGVDTTAGGAVQTTQNNLFQFNNVDVNGGMSPLTPK